MRLKYIKSTSESPVLITARESREVVCATNPQVTIQVLTPQYSVVVTKLDTNCYLPTPKGWNPELSFSAPGIEPGPLAAPAHLSRSGQRLNVLS